MVRLTLNGSPARTNDDNSANCTAPGHRDYNYRPIVNRLLLLLPPPPPLLLLLGALLLLLLVNDAADWDENGQRRCTDLPQLRSASDPPSSALTTATRCFHIVLCASLSSKFAAVVCRTHPSMLRVQQTADGRSGCSRIQLNVIQDHPRRCCVYHFTNSLAAYAQRAGLHGSNP